MRSDNFALGKSRVKIGMPRLIKSTQAIGSLFNRREQTRNFTNYDKMSVIYIAWNGCKLVVEFETLWSIAHFKAAKKEAEFYESSTRQQLLDNPFFNIKTVLAQQVGLRYLI